MQATTTDIKWKGANAWLVLCVYLFYWLGFSLHHFLAPAHQHEQKVCHHAPDEQHLHGEEYAAHDCSICQIAPSLAELPPLLSPVFDLPDFIAAALNFGESRFHAASPNKLSQPRAPPAHPA